jgi:hypothetical protein
MKKLLSFIATLSLWASIADAQLVPRQTVEPGAGLIFCTSADLTDTYTCPTATPIITAYAVNQPVPLTVATSNTGAASVNIRAIGAITILAHDGSTLTNNAITSGRPYLLIYNGANFLLYAVGSSGGAGLSGLTNNRVLKASGATAAVDSSCLDTGTSIDCGDLTGNYHQEDFATPTAAPHVHTWPAATGTIAQTTGALVTGNLPKWDSSGRLVDSGVAAPGAATFEIVFHNDRDGGLADTDDRAKIYPNLGGTKTITQVKCWTDTGTSTINLQRDDGSAANILASNLVCSTAGASTTSFSGSENIVAVDQNIDFVLVTAATSGTPTKITVAILGTK